MKALQLLNVETVIVFRTLSVVMVALGDVYFLNQSFSKAQIIGMMLICVGGLMYALADLNFNLVGYTWASAYLVGIVLNTVVIKQIFMNLPHMDNWEKTFYNNAMGLPLQMCMAVACEDSTLWYSGVSSLSWTGVSVVFGSCVMGFVISLAGTACRDAVSATAFNILGNLNKFVTILFSSILFGSQNSVLALSGLFVSLSGGAIYSLGDLLL